MGGSFEYFSLQFWVQLAEVFVKTSHPHNQILMFVRILNSVFKGLSANQVEGNMQTAFLKVRLYQRLEYMLSLRIAEDVGVEFHIHANDKCISCYECSRNCQVGIDVMSYALKQEVLDNETSSCIGCGICVTVCPMDTLSFNKPLVQIGEIEKQL